MLGKIAGKAQGAAGEGAKAAAAAQGQRAELFAAAKMDGASLPQAPQSAFRKRPVRLSYDKNEFYAFRLPSEHNFLMQNFDKTDVFGKRHGIQHSPHIKAQMDIDTKILLALIGASLLMLTSDFKRNG